MCGEDVMECVWGGECDGDVWGEDVMGVCGEDVMGMCGGWM